MTPRGWAVPLRAAALGVTVWGTAMVLGLPLRAWAGIVQDRAWGVWTASSGLWWYDTLLLDTVEILLVGLVSAVFILLLRARPRAWATDVVIAGTLLVALAALVWPMLILPLTATFTDLDDGPTAQAVRDTVQSAGLEDAPILVEVRSERDVRANAVVYGIGPSSRIVIDDNLLALPVDDVVTIVAHELAHHVHRDVERSVAGAALLLVILALAVRGTWNHPRVASGWRGIAMWPRTIRASFPVVLAVAMALSLVLEPAALWQSRRVEASADAASYDLGASPATMVVVQRRLSIVNLSPLERPTWHQVLFSTHPTSAERIRAAVARAEADGLDLPTREELDAAEQRLQLRWRQPD
jgi:STE24 endopeptidase